MLKVITGEVAGLRTLDEVVDVPQDVAGDGGWCLPDRGSVPHGQLQTHHWPTAITATH